MLYIDEVIAEFDEYLDDNNVSVQIEGHEWNPSHVLIDIDRETYLEELNIFIEDNYTVMDFGEGELFYDPIN